MKYNVTLSLDDIIVTDVEAKDRDEAVRLAIKPRRENPSACRGDESAHPSLSILTYTI